MPGAIRSWFNDLVEVVRGPREPVVDHWTGELVGQAGRDPDARTDDWDRAWSDYSAGREPHDAHAAELYDEWRQYDDYRDRYDDRPAEVLGDDDFSYAERAELAEAEHDEQARAEYQAGQADGQAARGEYWQELAERAGAEEKTDAAGREWYADDDLTQARDLLADDQARREHARGCNEDAGTCPTCSVDEAASYADVEHHQANLSAAQERVDQGKDEAAGVVNGPLPEDRTQVGGLTGSFNTTDDDRAMLEQEQAYDRAAADAAVVAMLALPEQQHDRGDEYGANGRAADIDQVQLEDAASYGY